MKIELVIPKTPMSLNRLYRLHWAKRHRILQEWIDEIWIAWLENKLRLKRGLEREKTIFRKAKIRVKYYFKDKRRRDRDNYAPKFILDSLRYNGIIEDDSTEHVDVDWEILQGSPERTEIEIEGIYEG